ncbi:PVC-type heme-binding CxxCH protein [Blastopirellula marina]|uniref:Cytochrome c-like protein n=1 Tax=Blastopirellula marina DSM 3645 TaxID=314230 RepID=A3ZS76_9BACT|nr:PVC-type heme-binding CxxCH protein [Blastopirellula marina]EAQ80534.1 Cytochrome c-like protein [Blastopirellula marina DSM 3645]
MNLRPTAGLLGVLLAAWTLVSVDLPTSTAAEPTFLPADESPAPTKPLEPQAGLAAWKARAGFRVELMAAEPLTMDPVAIDWDADGRLWVVEMADYPNGLDGNGKPGGRVRVLENTTADGPYDKSTLFIEGLNFPNGIVAWNDGVIVTAAPEILYLTDTNDDSVCDHKEVLFSGFHEGNQQLRMNGLRWGLDGWIYCASGSHASSYGSGTKIKSHRTGELFQIGSRDFRFHPTTGAVEPLSGPSQFGRNTDGWGNWFGVQNSFPLWHYVLEEKYLQRNPHLIAPESRSLLTKANPRVYPISEIESRFHSHQQSGRFTSACSGMVYRDSLLFPDRQDGAVAHSFTCEPVHNVIQRNVLTRQGVSFTMQRDSADEAVDFLASQDRWCRPVMVRTGPDGALWVVDMYRYVIEHPHWLPEAGKQAVAPYLRAGDGRGRIYRVVPEAGVADPPVRLGEQSTAALVELLDHSNGWIRDAAKRLLLETQDPALETTLRDFLSQDRTPLGRLNALYALHGVGKIDERLLVKGLADPAMPIRRHSLRMAENIADPGPELSQAIANLAEDPDPVIQFQLACSLGQWNQPFAAALMAKLLPKHLATKWTRTALLSSLTAENIAAVARSISELPLENDSVREVYRDVMRMALALDVHQPLLHTFSTNLGEAQDLARTMIAIDIVSRLPKSQREKLPAQAIAAIPQVAQTSRDLIASDTAPTWLKSLAINSLFLVPDKLSADLQLATQVLQPTVSSDLQKALIRRLGEQSTPECCDVLLLGWSAYSPQMRRTVLEVIASQPAWHDRFVQALRDRRLVAADIDLALQQRFLHHPAADQFRVYFESPAGSKKEMSSTTILVDQGDAGRGKIVFQKNCSVCHRFRDAGGQVGPNLGSLTNRTPKNLLEAIVAPNKSVDSKYLNYLIATIDGRVISGIITHESDHSLTILQANGESTAIFREDIEELQSTGKSLMPEGFGKSISHEKMADLVTYLMQQD